MEWFLVTWELGPLFCGPVIAGCNFSLELLNSRSLALKLESIDRFMFVVERRVNLRSTLVGL